MDTQITAIFTQLGVGGGIAALMFYFYRQDRKDSQDSLQKLGLDFKETVEANTQAMTKLSVLIEQKIDDHK